MLANQLARRETRGLRRAVAEAELWAAEAVERLTRLESSVRGFEERARQADKRAAKVADEKVALGERVRRAEARASEAEALLEDSRRAAREAAVGFEREKTALTDEASVLRAEATRALADASSAQEMVQVLVKERDVLHGALLDCLGALETAVAELGAGVPPRDFSNDDISALSLWLLSLGDTFSQATYAYSDACGKVAWDGVLMRLCLMGCTHLSVLEGGIGPPHPGTDSYRQLLPEIAKASSGFKRGFWAPAGRRIVLNMLKALLARGSSTSTQMRAATPSQDPGAGGPHDQV